MNSESKGVFRVEDWNEETFSEVENGPTLKKAHVKKIYSGEIEGEGILEYLFTYHDKTTADIYGLERFSGRVDDKHGTFIFEHKGEFENGMADINMTIVEKSGTGDLQGIEGKMHFRAGMEKEYSITLQHHLNKGLHLWKKLNTKS
jgi:hypothetical protein